MCEEGLLTIFTSIVQALEREQNRSNSKLTPNEYVPSFRQQLAQVSGTQSKLPRSTPRPGREGSSSSAATPRREGTHPLWPRSSHRSGPWTHSCSFLAQESRCSNKCIIYENRGQTTPEHPVSERSSNFGPLDICSKFCRFQDHWYEILSSLKVLHFRFHPLCHDLFYEVATTWFKQCGPSKEHKLQMRQCFNIEAEVERHLVNRFVTDDSRNPRYRYCPLESTCSLRNSKKSSDWLDCQSWTSTFLKSPFWWKFGHDKNCRFPIFKQLMS